MFGGGGWWREGPGGGRGERTDVESITNGQEIDVTDTFSDSSGRSSRAVGPVLEIVCRHLSVKSSTVW